MQGIIWVLTSIFIMLFFFLFVVVQWLKPAPRGWDNEHLWIVLGGSFSTLLCIATVKQINHFILILALSSSLQSYKSPSMPFFSFLFSCYMGDSNKRALTHALMSQNQLSYNLRLLLNNFTKMRIKFTARNYALGELTRRAIWSFSLM